MQIQKEPFMRFSNATIGIVLCLLAACHSKSSKDNDPAPDETPCDPSPSLAGDSFKSHDYVFPEGISAYEGGTRVLQLKTGRVYECKGFPYTQYCRQWTAQSTLFEPGTGSNWMAAWDLN
jgi:hypothetical protein